MNPFADISIRVTLVASFLAPVVYLYSRPAPTPEQVQAKEEAQRAEETNNYVQAETECMEERPYSAARADCIWEAQRDYPRGYVISLTNSLDAARAKHYYGSTN